jgi:ABC-type transport system involved in cytochrome bd biosynthesis fused ATPase/permease subunit
MTTTRNTFQEQRHREARLITTVLALVAGIGFLAAVVPAVEHGITTALVIGGAAIAGVLVARGLVRVVRHRLEDRADALTATAWRARHAPHLLHGDERAVVTAGWR